MAVYVDRLRAQAPRNRDAQNAGRRHGQRWCHMWGDWDAEAFEMAMKLGLKPYWAHESNALLHFDLVPTRRTRAIALGAVEMEIGEWYRQRAEGTINRERTSRT